MTGIAIAMVLFLAEGIKEAVLGLLASWGITDWQASLIAYGLVGGALAFLFFNAIKKDG